MHAAVRDEPQEVKPPAAALGALNRTAENGIFAKRPVCNGNIDTRNINEGNSSSAKVEVAHFAVAHLAGWQTDVRPTGPDQGMWVAGVQAVEVGGLGEPNGIVGRLRSLT